MEKVKLEFKVPKTRTVEYNGVEIQVLPYLGLNEQTFLINQYLKDYFDPKGSDPLVPYATYSYLEAEFNLNSYLFQMLTNIDVAEMDNEFFADSKLHDVVCKEVTNYLEFRERLWNVVDEIKEQRNLDKSVGGVIDSLSQKLIGVLDEFKQVDPKQIENLQTSANELYEKVKALKEVEIVTSANPTPAKRGRPKKDLVQ